MWLWWMDDYKSRFPHPTKLEDTKKILGKKRGREEVRRTGTPE